MGIEQHTLTIGEYEYTVTQLAADKGIRTGVKLANLAGPAFKFVDDIEAGIGNMLASLKPEDLEFFYKLFGEHTRVSGPAYQDKDGSALRPLLTNKVFAEHFAGNYIDLFAWLAFCVKVNYESFFDGIGGLVKQYVPQEAAKQGSQ